MNWLSRTVLPKIKALVTQTDNKENLWVKCGSCGQMIFHRDFEENWHCCSSCGFHAPLTPELRLKLLCDADTLEMIPIDAGEDSDPLGFRDRKRYGDRLTEARKNTGHDDALVVAAGHCHGAPVVVAVFNFAFMGGSMGQSVGDGIITAVGEAIKRRAALIIVPSSGGARMQEGILSLMQLPRTIVAIDALAREKLPYIVLLAHPTTGGVTASFAMLGDVHIAEPGAIIGFAGRRVIEETVHEQLPENFQSAEYLQEHGMVDMVVPRAEQKQTISRLLNMLMAEAPKRAAG